MTDALEAFTHALTGLLVSVLFVLAKGWEAGLLAALAASGQFFVLSTLRSYGVRRFFRWMGGMSDSNANGGYE